MRKLLSHQLLINASKYVSRTDCNPERPGPRPENSLSFVWLIHGRFYDEAEFITTQKNEKGNQNIAKSVFRNLTARSIRPFVPKTDSNICTMSPIEENPYPTRKPSVRASKSRSAGGGSG
jgi:hypothetical protein